MAVRKGGGKQKGSAFERMVCKRLSLLLSNGERDDLFWRSAMSGGRATVLFNRGADVSNQAGDISAISPLGAKFVDRFFVECKSYKTFELDTFLYSGKGRFATFWKTADQEASKYNKFPMLIAKENRRPVIVCVQAWATNWFGLSINPLFTAPGANGLVAYDFDRFTEAVDVQGLNKHLNIKVPNRNPAKTTKRVRL